MARAKKAPTEHGKEKQKPWELAGVSKATYYRQQKAHAEKVLLKDAIEVEIAGSKPIAKRVKPRKSHEIETKKVETSLKKAKVSPKVSKSQVRLEKSHGKTAGETETASTAKKLPAHLNPDVQFKPGQSGNPAGRPKGSRNKLTEAFITAMCQDFEIYGMSAIVATRESKPEAYLTACTKIIPAQVEVGEAGAFDGLTDDELDALLVQRMASLQRHQAERSAYLQ